VTLFTDGTTDCYLPNAHSAFIFFSNSSTVNAALEAARDIGSPIIIQFSNGGAAYFAGKGLSNEGQKASILGAVAGAQVRLKSP
jgi:fructose/tagatose bisphosphate aldolase